MDDLAGVFLPGAVGLVGLGPARSAAPLRVRDLPQRVILFHCAAGGKPWTGQTGAEAAELRVDIQFLQV